MLKPQSILRHRWVGYVVEGGENVYLSYIAASQYVINLLCQEMCSREEE